MFEKLNHWTDEQVITHEHVTHSIPLRKYWQKVYLPLIVTHASNLLSK